MNANTGILEKVACKDMSPKEKKYRNILAKVINKRYTLEKSGYPNYANTLHFYNLIVEIKQKRLGIGLLRGNSEPLIKVNFVHKYTDQISSLS